MTVCIAAICQWQYKPGDRGSAIVTASDRMLTSGAVQYEPNQAKFGRLGRRTLSMISGEIAPLSDTIMKTQQSLNSGEADDPPSIAEVFARHLRTHRARHAAAKFLAPLGLDSESFIANQHMMEPSVVASLVRQIQYFQLECEAIIAGCDDSFAYLYRIDREGQPTQLSDLGFVSIGIGSSHADSHFMQINYAKTNLFFPALTAVYWAKRKAEAAPSVGKATDINLLTRNGVEPIRDELRTALEQAYEQEGARRREFESATSQDLNAKFATALEQMGRATRQPAVDPTGSEAPNPRMPVES